MDYKLTPEEMDMAFCLADLNVDKFGHNAVAQAQLDKAEPLIRKAERERIFIEIEKKGVSSLEYQGGLREIEIPETDWQALKGGKDDR